MWINRNVRSRQTPFSSFLIWLSAGDWLIWVVKGGDESYPGFPSEFGGQGLSLCLLDFSTRVRLGFGLPASGEDCSLESPWSYADAQVCKRAETGLVWGF